MVFGALAFAAAFQAAMWARKAFEHERAPVLAQERCDACDQPMRQLALEIVKRGFVEPSAELFAQARSVDFDVHNIGKTAIGDVEVGIDFLGQDATKAARIWANIGAIPAGGCRHGRLFISPSLLHRNNSFTWAAARGKLPRLNKNDRGKAIVDIDFFHADQELYVGGGDKQILVERWPESRGAAGKPAAPIRPIPKRDDNT